LKIFEDRSKENEGKGLGRGGRIQHSQERVIKTPDLTWMHEEPSRAKHTVDGQKEGEDILKGIISATREGKTGNAYDRSALGGKVGGNISNSGGRKRKNTGPKRRGKNSQGSGGGKRRIGGEQKMREAPIKSGVTIMLTYL